MNKTKKTNNNCKAKSKNSYRGKNYSKQMREEAAREVDTKSSYNDASWYTRNGEAAKAATQISMNVPAGSFFHRNNPRSSASLGSLALPSVMAFNMIPTLGVGSTRSEKNDAINLAAVKIYADIRRMNTGTSSYDQRTMMMFFMAMDSIYSAYAHLVRIYKTLNLYSSTNRNLPDVLLASLGIDKEAAENLRSNMADFHFWLINLEEQINLWNVPGNMDIMKRHYWLYSNVYADSESSRASMYIFKPEGFFIWGEEDGQWVLTLKPFEDEVMDLNYFKSYMNDLLAALYRSQDLMTINGDVLKVYDKSKCFSVSHPSSVDVMSISYNKEILMQINNMVMLGRETTEQVLDTLPYGNYAIYEDLETFTLVQDIFTNPFGAEANPLLNFYHDNPTSDEILVATRLMPTVEWVRRGGYGTGSVVTCGADVALDATIYMLGQSQDNGNISIDTVDLVSYVSSSQDIMTIAAYIACFDYHPAIYVLDSTGLDLARNLESVAAWRGSVAYENIIRVIFDFDNTVYLPLSALNQLNITCNFSLFGVV